MVTHYILYAFALACAVKHTCLINFDNAFRSDAMYIRTLVLGDKFTYDKYYGSLLNFKPK